MALATILNPQLYIKKLSGFFSSIQFGKEIYRYKNKVHSNLISTCIFRPMDQQIHSSINEANITLPRIHLTEFLNFQLDLNQTPK